MASLSLLAINGLDLSLLGTIPTRLARIFNLEVRASQISFNPEPYYHRARGQYHSTGFLKRLIGGREDGEAKVLGVADVDLFAPVLTFVFGEAQLGGTAAVLSTYRLRNEFYGLPASWALLVERITKEAIHEIGHVMGLLHCPDYNCAMHFAISIDAVDVKFATLCPTCAGLLEGK